MRVHLREQHNIRSTKDVKIHLDDLSSDDRLALIEKISHGAGNANSYRIREGFNSLKRLHNYLDAQGLVPRLMTTRYFSSYLATMDFETKVRTNLTRNSILELYEGITDDRGYELIRALLCGIDESDREAMDGWMRRIRAGDRDDPLSGSFLALIDLLKEGDIDRLGEIFISLVQVIRENRGGQDLSEFFALMSELSMPEDQLKMVYVARQFSPGALDYLLNSSRNNHMFPPNIFLAYVYSLILQAPAGEVPDGLPPVDFARYRRYAAALPRHSGQAPIALIVRSLFIADMVHGRLTVKEVPEETLRLIFST